MLFDAVFAVSQRIEQSVMKKDKEYMAKGYDVGKVLE